jgi:hypothetical protein
MTPSATIKYNYNYAKSLFRGESAAFDEHWQALIALGTEFEIVFEPTIIPILKAIPEVTGYEWTPEQAVIPVYLAATGENLVAPLTIIATSDPELMLYDLAELLVRLNLQTGFPNDLKRDQAVHEMTKAVFLQAGLRLDDAISEADVRLREKYGADLPSINWDLSNKTFKEYQESN